MRLLLFSIAIVWAGSSFAQVSNELWDMCSKGGKFDNGVIFKIDANGDNYSIQYEFPNIEGGEPIHTQLSEYNGKLYGLTSKEGNNNKGVLFEYDLTTKDYYKKYDFGASITDGANPYGSLLLTPDGKMYGMTKKGGANGKGVLFVYDPSTNMLTNLVSFDGTNGASPKGDLMLAQNGIIYGTTTAGGARNAGVLFSYDISSPAPYQKLLDFSTYKLKAPCGKLIEVGSGVLYGLASDGQISSLSNGGLYKYIISSGILSIKTLSVLTGSNNYTMQGSLCKSSNDILYGGAIDVNNTGLIFEYNSQTDAFTKSFEFNGSGVGSNPVGQLIETANNKFYGLSFLSQNSNVLYEFDPDNLTSPIVSKTILQSSITGARCLGSPYLASNGRVYGLASWGGTTNGGGIFEYNPTTNTASRIAFFGEKYYGWRPFGKLSLATNGKLYGMTKNGGESNPTGVNSSFGVLFEFDPSTKKFRKLHDFKYQNGISGSDYEGAIPENFVTPVGNKVYGVTVGGGRYKDSGLSPGNPNGYGVLFEYDLSTNTYSEILDFNGTNGAHPYGGLLYVSSLGKLIGTTSQGGLNGVDAATGNLKSEGGGVIFEYDLNSQLYTVKHNFLDIDGSEPYGSLIQVSNGLLYGMTTKGGGTGRPGVIFSYEPVSGTYTKKFVFNNTTGTAPRGSLIQATNENLFGNTVNGGTLFEYNISNNTIDVRKQFNASDGYFVYGSLAQSSNEKLYGMTSTGGLNYANNNQRGGVIFEYDINTHVYTKKKDLTTAEGEHPIYSQFINVSACPPETPSVIASTSSDTICLNQSVTLAGSSSSAYSWSDGVNDGVAFNPASTHTYTITATDANGCSNSDSIKIVVLSLPNVGIISSDADNSMCEGDALILSGTGAVSYSWTGGITNATSFNASAANTSFTVTGTDGYGCSNTTTISIIVNALPSVTISGNAEACPNTYSFITAGGADTYLWSNNETTPSINVLPGTYTVTGTSYGCSSSATMVVAQSTKCSTVPCGLTLNTLNAYTVASVPSGMTVGSQIKNFKFKLYDLNNQLVGELTQASNYIWFQNIPGILFNHTYKWSVQIEYYTATGTAWGPESTPCDLTIEEPVSAVPCGQTYSSLYAYTTVPSPSTKPIGTHIANYKFRLYSATGNFISSLTQASPQIWFQDIPSILFNRTYKWSVQIEYITETGTAWGPESTPCDLTIEEPVSAVPCGQTYNSLYAYTTVPSPSTKPIGIHIANYKFRFYNTAGAIIGEKTQPSNQIWFNSVAGLTMNSQYNWSVQIEYITETGTAWCAESTPCLITIGVPSNSRIINQEVQEISTITEGVISSKEKNEMIVYPNPSNSGMVNVSVEFLDCKTKLSVTDIRGRLVYQKQNINTHESINTEGFEQGIYSITIENLNLKQTKQLIIVK